MPKISLRQIIGRSLGQILIRVIGGLIVIIIVAKWTAIKKLLESFYIFFKQIFFRVHLKIVLILIVIFFVIKFVTIFIKKHRIGFQTMFLNREKEIDHFLNKFIHEQSLSSSPCCLIIWGEEGIGKSRFSNHLATSIKIKFIRNRLFFWKRSLWQIFSLSIGPGESFSNALGRSFLKDDIKGRTSFEILDQVLICLPYSSIIFVDDLDENNLEELEWMVRQIETRRLRVKLVTTSTQRLSPSPRYLYSYIWEDTGLSPLTNDLIRQTIKSVFPSLTEGDIGEILSLSEGNIGRSLSIARLVTEHDKENWKQYLPKYSSIPSGIKQSHELNEFLRLCVFIQSNGGVITHKLLNLFESNYDKLANKLKEFGYLNEIKTDEITYRVKRVISDEIKKSIQDSETKTFAGKLENILRSISDKQIRGLSSTPGNLILLLWCYRYLTNEFPSLSALRFITHIQSPQDLKLLGKMLFENPKIELISMAGDQLYFYGLILNAKAEYRRCIEALDIFITTCSTSRSPFLLEARLLLAETLRRVGLYLRCRDVILAVTLEPQFEKLDSFSKLKAFSVLGKAYIGLGDHNSARQAYDRAKGFVPSDISSNITDSKEFIEPYRGINLIMRDRGRYHEALEQARILEKRIRGKNLRLAEGYVARTLASCSQMLWLFEDALQYNHFALDRAKDLSHYSLESNCIWGFAEIYRYQGQFDASLQHYAQALERYIEAGDQQGAIYSHLGLADIYLKTKSFPESSRSYAEAKKITNEGSCKLEEMYIKLGEIFVNEKSGITNKSDDLSQIRNFCRETGESSWVRILIELILLYRREPADETFIKTRLRDFHPEAEYFRNMDRYRDHKLPPYMIIPQRF